MLLSIFTGLLALFTGGLFCATYRLVRQGQSDVEAQWRPVLILGPIDRRSPDTSPIQGSVVVEERRVGVLVMNDGRGPAKDVRMTAITETGEAASDVMTLETRGSAWIWVANIFKSREHSMTCLIRYKDLNDRGSITVIYLEHDEGWVARTEDIKLAPRRPGLRYRILRVVRHFASTVQP